MLQDRRHLSTGQEWELGTDSAAAPSEWAQRMAALSTGMARTGWKRHGIIVRRSRRIHDRVNHIREQIEDISSDLMSMIPSARWLVDNFQMIYREIKKLNFSTSGYSVMPVLKSGPWKGLPRAYMIAREMVSLSGGLLGEENILLMLRAYQDAAPLTDRELQVLPEMLGLALLERMEQVALAILDVARAKAAAERFVNERLSPDPEAQDISPLLSPQDKRANDIHFHSHALFLLRGLAMDQEALQRYIAYHFTQEAGHASAVELFLEESRLESMLESAIRNPILSLRELNELDQDTLFEELSALERILLNDPDGVYPGMDSQSRAMYRAAAEKLAIRYRLEETRVADTALRLASQGHKDLHEPRHVGSYLIGRGQGLLKMAVRNKPLPEDIKKPFNLRAYAYFVSAGLLSAGLLALGALLAARANGGGALKIILLLLAALPVLGGIGLKITNSLFSRSAPAKALPAMDYSTGLPEKARTWVVMPVIISRPEQGPLYLDRLYKHYLANRQDNLHFALLADYHDAKEQDMPGDRAIREAMLERLTELNEQYPSPLMKFSLFIRERRYNSSENCFMCWERKRGKLEEFNRLLNGEAPENTSFRDIVTDPELLTARYVITLDADSDLALDNASRLAGILSHPLNRAVVDPDSGRVTEGYAIIQPQVMNHIAEPGNSAFTRIYAGKTGLPNYSMAVSDIYQDVFKAGVFVGKGIYDARVFHRMLGNIIPENRVLSHDLLESCYARTGFAGNTHIVESFPGSFAAYIKRQHRWIRGDWQLLPWLGSRNLDGLSKWKIVDDLRSSLESTSKLLVILLGALLLPRAWWLWALLLAMPLALDLMEMLADILAHFIRRGRHVLLYRKLLGQLSLLFSRAALDLVFIPYEAANSLDAIIRTLYRLLVSKKRFLEWDSADQVERTSRHSLTGYLTRMWVSLPAAGILILALDAAPISGGAAFAHALLASAWAFSAVIAHHISKAGQEKRKVGAAEETLLRDNARRTWRFFQEFSNEENHFLCPDNYQLGRKEKITHKTSPTNIGLQFLSALSAWDLGFETLGSTLTYLENVLKAVSALPTWQGHLYNWYDTRTLQTLSPHYVSSVDSGNFFGYLLTLRSGLMEMAQAPLVSRAALMEMNALLRELHSPVTLKSAHGSCRELLDDLSRVRDALAHKPEQAYLTQVREFSRLSNLIAGDIGGLCLEDGTPLDSLNLPDLAKEGNAYAQDLVRRLHALADTVDSMVKAADFGSLYNPRRRLFYVGFNVVTQAYDRSCYDLAASEALLLSLLAIAKGDVPVRHWQRLGRPQTIIKGRPAHVSWSGTMFEYLMPRLVLREYAGSVFEDSSIAAVTQQMRYAQRHSIPWGMSESQYYRFDTRQNYQYKAFGVPKLRLQPVYEDMLIVSPYSTLLALEYAGDKAFVNLNALRERGAYGEYGFFEALDFTVPDPVTLQPFCVVKSFMAHHLGMGLAATNNYLNQGVMRERFHRLPMVRAAASLLEETHLSLFATPSRRGYTIQFKNRDLPQDGGDAGRQVRTYGLPVPMSNYLSNGGYSLLVTSDGDGFSRRREVMLNRWRADTGADTGFYVYIRDIGLDTFWSAAYHPTRVKPDRYQVNFSAHQARFLRQDKGIVTQMEVSLTPDDSLELRRVTLKNLSGRERRLEVTGFLEVALDTQAAESSHPAFNKLFLQSEFLAEHGALLASRRVPGGDSPTAMMMLRGGADGKVEYETGRMNFIGRNGSLQSPRVIREGLPLSNSAAFTGDPIMSLRRQVTLPPGGEMVMLFAAGLFDSREDAISACGAYQAAGRAEDALERFRQQSRIELAYLGISGGQLRAIQNIIRQLYYPYRYFRGPAENIRRNWDGQSGLWKFGISGDLPILLLLVKSEDDARLVRDVLKVYEYMGINQARADLVIIAEGNYGYTSELTNMLTGMTSSLKIYDSAREQSGIYVLHSYELAPSDMDLLYTVARLVVTGDSGIYFRRGALPG